MVCRFLFQRRHTSETMMPIPSYQQWMSETALALTKPRSSLLRALDGTIQQYEQKRTEQNLFRIRNAFEDWKRSKDTVWENSERNRKQAISRLSVALSTSGYRTFQITHFSMQELLALKYVNDQRKRVIASIFEGKEVNLKAARIKEPVKTAAQEVADSFSKAAAYIRSIGKEKQPSSSESSTTDSIQQKLEGLVKSLFSVNSLDQLGSLSGTILTILGKVAVSVPPVVGQIKDGYDLFTNWANAGASLYEQFGVSDRNYVLDTGAPAQAFAALRSLLAQETKKQTIAASQATASFALKTGLAFVDGGAISGPVIGAVSALATLAQQLYYLAVEWRATQAVSAALKAGELDVRLFRTYPLMGCYLIISGTLSDLIPIDCFGTPGWMTYIENTKHQFDAIYHSATKLVDASPWEIQGLPKRKAGTSASLFGEGSRLAGLGSSISGLAGLTDIR